MVGVRGAKVTFKVKTQKKGVLQPPIFFEDGPCHHLAKSCRLANGTRIGILAPVHP